jgi:tricorn protease
MRSLLILVLTCICANSLSSEPNARPYFYEPSVSPATNEVAFVSGGDIWTVPLTGGDARLLISNPANDTRPLFSPDGKQLAFMSNRTGNEDIFVLTIATGDVRRVTYDDGNDHLDAWSRDGKYLYFSSATNDINAMNDAFRIPAAGGMPMPVTADRFAAEYWAAPSPTSTAVAFTAKGTVAGQWWRRGHSHLDESEIWLVSPGAKYEKLSGGGSKDAWPMWSSDGKRIYFMSDRSGAENLWVKDAAPTAPARQLTTFKDGRLLWPTISYDGRTIVFERDLGIWKLDTATNKAAPIEIALHGAPAGPDVTRLNSTGQFRDLILSPDGKKIAFVSHGEIFAGSSKEPGSATRVTMTPGNEFGVAWSPDSRKIIYVSDRAGSYHIYEYDFIANAEMQLTRDPKGETSPRWSPDGKLISYIRGGQDVVAYDLTNKQETVLATSHFAKPPQEASYEWSPDGKWLAYAARGEKQFCNVNVVPAAGGKPEPVSFLSNTNCRSVAWSPDGTYLLFSTGQRTEPAMVARVDLIPKVPVFREDRFRDLFKDEPERPGRGAAAVTKPTPKVQIEFGGIRRRLSILPVNVDANSLKISPDGKTLLMTANVAGQQNLYTFSLDDSGGGRGERVARQVTSTAGQKSNAQWTPDGKEIYYLEAGRLSISTLETRLSRPLAVTAEMDIDFREEKQAVFQQAWQYLNDNFFDPEFNGIDWRAARARYEPVIAGAHTGDEERRIISLMIGDLNSSHSGISMAEVPPPAPVTGRLGLRFDPAAYEADGKLHIAEVISQTPADIAGLKAGQILEAVDHQPVVNLDQALEHKVDKRVVLTIAVDGVKKDVPVKPVSRAVEKQLLYRQWVESRRDYVDKASKGTLGYVHMADMSQQALDQLYLDLDAANQSKRGIVVDIRNNNGGFVNAYALDVLSRQHYLNMTPRGTAAAVPARTALGQRSLELPTILVVNQHSLSDAEDFTEGYRSMKLGKVVGEPTAGWIIYTSNFQLIDGSSLRLPSTRITTANGEPMEMHPRPVDILVERPIGESYTGKDLQLDAAVANLEAALK